MKIGDQVIYTRFEKRAWKRVNAPDYTRLEGRQEIKATIVGFSKAMVVIEMKSQKGTVRKAVKPETLTEEKKCLSA